MHLGLNLAPDSDIGQLSALLHALLSFKMGIITIVPF